MDGQRHIIQKQIFDISFISGKRPFELQNRISSLFYSQLENVIVTVLDQMIPEEMLIKFDVLEVDMGILSYDYIENSFPDQLKEALEKAIKDKLSLPVNYPDSINNNADSGFKSSYLDLLAYFLITGSLPWWASGQTMTNPEKVLGLLLKKNLQAVKQLIIKVGQFYYVRRRLIYQFSEETLHSIVNVLEPDEADFIFEYHREIVKTQHTRQPVKDETSEVSKAIWLFIFTYLLIDRGNNFNRKIFVKSTLKQMADHYNLHYDEMLKLFTIPLDNKTILKESGNSLSNIIKELFFEQLPDHYSENNHNDTRNKLRLPRTKSIKKKESLIRHYLDFGTLPSWADRYDDKQLNIVFSELIQNIPEVTKQLILALENKETAIQNILFAFDITVITGIIKIVEPAHSEFIINYMERVQTVQYKKSIVSADNKAFTQSVRQFVLTYLLIDRGSVFNTRMFLESNIRQMAHKYNLHFERLLVFLIQGISEEYHSTKEPLFHLLTDILKAHKNSTKGKETNAIITSQQQEDTTLRRKTTTRSKTYIDMLRFWIMYGYFPWWAKRYANKLPEEIWEEVVLNHPVDALNLIKYAGIGHTMKQRIAYQLPLSTLLAAFGLLPDGKKAIEIYEYTAYLLESFAELKIKNKPALQNILILAWWDTFISAGYQIFDLNQFIAFSLYRLSQWTGVYVENIRHSLLKIAHQHIEKIHPGKLKPALRFFTEALNDPLKITKEWTGNDYDPDIRIMIAQYMFPNGKVDNENILQESLQILEHYLTYGKLPEQIPGLTPALLDTFLKRLLQLLIREKPAALRAILKQETHLPAARMRIHDLFSMNAESDSKNIQDLLEEFYLKDLFQYFAETSGAQATIPENERFQEMLDKIVHYPSDYREKELLHTLLSSPAITRYMAEKYENSVLYNLVKNTISKREKETVTFLQQVQQMLSLAIPDTLIKKKADVLFWQFSLHFLAGAYPLKTPSQYFSSFLPMLAHVQPAGEIKLYQSLLKVTRTRLNPSASIPGHLISHIQEQLKMLIEQKSRQADFKQALIKTDELTLQGLNGHNVKQQDKKLLSKISGELMRKQKQEEEAAKEQIKKTLNIKEETIYIRNAGLVLFHPFLSTYFTRIELMEKGKFIREENIFSAIHLLQFLVDGKQKHPEHEMVLNKILCGLPIEEPVPAEIVFTQQEIEVSLELLNVITERWEQLKNTSVEGFRASFLQREGALTFGDDSWKLRVDQRGYDVLLQTLPWSFGMIKTSWMEKILYVEWI